MKLSTEALQALFKEVKKRVDLGSVWRHKKGGVYLVVGYGYDTERETINVHYTRVNGPGYNQIQELGIVFDRPFEEWNEERFTQLNPFRDL